MTEGGRKSRAEWLPLAMVALASAAAHQLGLLFLDPAAQASTVWPASGVGLAALLLRPRSARRGVYLTLAAVNLSINLLVGARLPMALGALASNLLELWLAVLLLDRTSAHVSFRKVREVTALLIAASAACIVAAALGAAMSALMHGVGFWLAHRTWWIADGLGMLVVTPLLVSWLRPRNSAAKLAEELAFVGSWSAALWLTFRSSQSWTLAFPPYVLIGLLAWPALRLGQRFVTLALSALALIAIASTRSGQWQSPWGGQNVHDHLLLLQLYLGFAGSSTLLFAASVSEQRAAQHRSRRAEERSRQDAERLGIALEAASMGTWEWHIASNETFWSRNIDAVLLQGPASFARTFEAYMALVHPDDRPEVERAIAQVMERGSGSYKSDHRIRAADGSWHWMESQGRLDSDSQGKPLRLAGTLVDVSERKADAQALQASDLLLRQCIKFTPAAVAMFDTEMRYLQASERWLTDYHLEGQEIIGRCHYDVFPDIPQSWRDVHQRVLAGAVERSDNDPFQRENGTKEWLSWEVRPWRKPDGAIGGLVMFTQVITERKRVEERNQQLQDQLRQAQKLEALGTLAGGIAHDFNNILSAIVAYTQLAQLDNPNNRELHGQLSEILHASSRATRLVQQILSFSRRQGQQRTTLGLAPVIKEALKLLRSTLPATIEIQEEISTRLPDVLADPTQMHQVLMNLCTNASHAMKGRGHLKLELARYRLGPDEASPHLELRPGSYVRLSVTDDGQGMDAQVQSRIFEPFFTTKGSGEGTGLGLAVVHGIVKEHDGIITVQSQLGSGTTFSVYLPAAEPTQPLVDEALADVPLGHGQHVMFVDDEAALCTSARHILKRLGYTPHVFQDPQAAWQAFQAEPARFDALVTDLTMPVRTGLDLADDVLRLRPGLPIVLASGYSATLTPEILEERGVRELLHKPVDYRALAAALARALPRRLERTA